MFMNADSCHLLFQYENTRRDVKTCKQQSFNTWHTIIMWQKVYKVGCGKLPTMDLYLFICQFVSDTYRLLRLVSPQNELLLNIWIQLCCRFSVSRRHKLRNARGGILEMLLFCRSLSTNKWKPVHPSFLSHTDTLLYPRRIHS